jgi:hypothetical protein
MAITLSANFIAELRKGENTPDTILEGAIIFTEFIADGTYIADGSILAEGSSEGEPIKWGFTTCSRSDVLPILKSVSSLQNKLDPKTGYSTRGQITAVLVGRDNFKDLIQDQYLKNKRVVRKDGFLAPGFDYDTDYADTFTGKIIDWSRKGDELTLVIGDDMQSEGNKKFPVEETGNTQTLDFRNTNPVDIIQALLKTHMGIEASLVDDAKFDSEQSLWLSGWLFDRVLTKPVEANKLLNELQVETNSFVIHDGELISFKHFAPPIPGQTIEEYTDDYNILDGSFTQKSGYKDQFFNRVVVYYDYNESGDENASDYAAAYIAADTSSSAATQWDETKTKTIMSKWIRSFTYTQTSTITGVTIYHVSVDNGLSAGATGHELKYVNATNTITWTAPDGTEGAAVTLDKDGTYQVFDTNLNKWVRIVVDFSVLPTSDKTDSIDITALAGESFATYLADKLLARFRDPSAIVNFSIDLNDEAYEAKFIKPTDLKDVTTDEAMEKGKSSWNKERLMLTSIKPNGNKLDIEAVQTRLFKRYGFIAPASQPDWDSANEVEKQYAYIGDINNFLGTADTEGFVIW